MQPAADAMEVALSGTGVKSPLIPLVANITARPVTDPDTIRQLLVQQVTGRVRWRESIAWLAETREDRRRWTADNGDLLTIEGKRVATDWLTQRAESLLRYERWRDNALVESQMEPMAQRYWGVEEFRLALEASGFAEITVTGGYRHGRAPRSAGGAITFEAIRK